MLRGQHNYWQRTVYVETISQISFRASHVCSRGFTCEALCTVEIENLPGTDFTPIFALGKPPGLNVPGHLDRGVFKFMVYHQITDHFS